MELFTIIWTQDALDDVTTAAGRSPTPEAGDALAAAIFAAVAGLDRSPYLGPVSDAHAAGRYRELLCRQYIIYYAVDDTARRVEVARVWHAARRSPPRLPG